MSKSTSQKQIIDDVNSGKIPLEGYEGHKVGNNTRKSNYGEMNTDLKMESITEIDGKPASLTALHEKITDIDTPIKQGIDHIYQNATPPPKYVIAESKYGSSKLNKKTGQMSRDWCKDRIEKMFKDDLDKMEDILDAIDNGEVSYILSEIDKLGNVRLHNLNNFGKIINPLK
ncbi:MAG: hypothetical protein Q4B43_10665 [Bacteroidota bacterium]|nr:hypothetical protein [Bacteroidota bacterium]